MSTRRKVIRSSQALKSVVANHPTQVSSQSPAQAGLAGRGGARERNDKCPFPARAFGVLRTLRRQGENLHPPSCPAPRRRVKRLPLVKGAGAKRLRDRVCRYAAAVICSAVSLPSIPPSLLRRATSLYKREALGRGTGILTSSSQSPQHSECFYKEAE